MPVDRKEKKMLVEKIVNTSFEKVRIDLNVGTTIYLKPNEILERPDVKNLNDLISNGKVLIDLGEDGMKFRTGKRS